MAWFLFAFIIASFSCVKQGKGSNYFNVLIVCGLHRVYGVDGFWFMIDAASLSKLKKLRNISIKTVEMTFPIV